MRVLSLLFALLLATSVQASEADRGVYKLFWNAVATTADDQVAFTTGEDRFNAGNFIICQLISSGGGVEVKASYDGGSTYSNAISLSDDGATNNDPVLFTATGNRYTFLTVGATHIRVIQYGAGTVTAYLACR